MNEKNNQEKRKKTLDDFVLCKVIRYSWLLKVFHHLINIKRIKWKRDFQ